MQPGENSTPETYEQYSSEMIAWKDRARIQRIEIEDYEGLGQPGDLVWPYWARDVKKDRLDQLTFKRLMTGGLDLMNYIRMRLFMALAQTPFHVTRWDEEPDLRHPRFKLWNVLPLFDQHIEPEIRRVAVIAGEERERRFREE